MTAVTNVNAVQTLTFGPGVTGGTFTLTFNGQATAPITWDPNPAAPAEYRGPLGAIPTRLPGVQFGELLPRQAALADKLAVVRTVNHGSGDHTKSNHWMLTGFEGPAFNAPDFRHQKRPSLGSAGRCDACASVGAALPPCCRSFSSGSISRLPEPR